MQVANLSATLADMEQCVQPLHTGLKVSVSLSNYRYERLRLGSWPYEVMRDEVACGLTSSLQQFRAEVNAATNREASLHILTSMQRSVSEVRRLFFDPLVCKMRRQRTRRVGVHL